MTDTRRLIFLILILGAVGTFIAGVTNYFTYIAALEQNLDRLRVSAQSQARMIEAVARFDAQYSTDYPGGAVAAAISKIIEAHDNSEVFGETGEFAIARREGGQIIFLFRQRHSDLDHPRPVSFDSDLAEPMRQALLGQSGTMTGLDYRGENVVAAYEPVAVLNLGIVAKIDLTEIRAPFIEAGIVTGIAALAAILMGAFLFVRTTNPMIERIRQSEEKFRNLFEHATDSIFILDPATLRILDVNENAAKRLGYTKDELLQQKIDDLYPRSETGKIREIIKKMLIAGHVEFESIQLRKDKTELPVEVNVQIIHYSGNRVFQCFVRDITEKNRAEKELRESEELMRSVLESAADGIFITDQNGTIETFNRSAEKIFGYPSEEVVQRNVTLLIPDEFHGRHNRGMGKIRQGHQDFIDKTIEVTGLHKQGNRISLAITISEFVLGNDRKFTGIVRDITERLRAEERISQQQKQLVQADKLSTLGVLVAGVAHEINNPNMSIVFNLPVLQRFFSDVFSVLNRNKDALGDFTLAAMPIDDAEEDLQLLLTDMSTASQRIKSIVENLKEYVREGGGGAKGDISLAKVVASSVALVGARLKEATKYFSNNVEADLPFVYANFQELEQVVINLLTNACDALPNDGRAIVVSSEYDHRSGGVVIVVTDEGYGIAPELISSITDPFFTTKRDSGGTGLGLSISYGIAKEHGGDLVFESVLGEGTSVKLILPISKSKAAAGQAE